MQAAARREETWRRKESATRRRLSKRGARDVHAGGDAGAGEFVRLAAAIEDGAAFNPKQWRRVLDTSTAVLQASSNLSNGRRDKRDVGRVERAATQRPLSREEDSMVDGGGCPPLSVTQYLSQPDMVKDILREVEGELEVDEDVSVEKEEDGVAVQPEVLAEANDEEVGDVVLEDEGVSPIRHDIVEKEIPAVSGKAYMRLVRQTQAARAQRKKDDKVRSSLVYKVKAAFGVSPALNSDTKQEVAARKQRFDDIKHTLFLQRRSGDKSNAKKHWSKKQKARVLEAAGTWCDYDEPVKILKGEWKNCVGSIVSTQNLMLTGSVLVFVPLANRSVVVRWEDIKPYDQDEALRQAYVPPSQIALNVTRDFHAKISRILEGAIRKARLLYLQTIEFNRIMQYAWVVEYDKREEKVEYWNVVLNRRVSTPPKAMQIIERMEPEDREKLEKRVELARSKLVTLLNPFQSKNKPKLALRRNAIVFVPSGIIVEESNTSLASLKLEMESIDAARFWHDKVLPNRQLGGKKARKFLAASPPKACWWVVKLFVWMDLHAEDGFEPQAKKLLSMPEELQVYVVREVSDRFEQSGDANLAKEKLAQLMGLKTATLQLLVTKDQRDAEEEESRQAP
ncbi:E3 ubiquitin-protein ligase UPL6 [Phytophthora cinnamomi]|uniref:E3 ubiquitin-protein ligase UPL6 n=1 Tax=Phytophthora cinnamomi TaxID=4785 RepID=UPI0035598802|nr:E3 ubiquitin-protein ligase UPL6 [Phytophthora cinnamomi]